MRRPEGTSTALAWFAALAVFAATMATSASWAGEGKASVDLSASLRTIALAIDHHGLGGNRATEGVSQTIARVVAEGRASERWSWEVHLVEVLDVDDGAGAAGTGAFSFAPTTAQRYRAIDARWDQDDDGRVRASLEADRFAVKAAFGWGDVTLGRQPITLGKAYFWNPLDEFLAFDPRSFDRDYKPGVDALRIEVPAGPFAGLGLFAVAGTSAAGGAKRRGVDADWEGSALLLRGFATQRGWDFAAQGGKVDGGYQAGAGAVGELGPIEVRLEGVYLAAVDSPRLPLPLSGSLRRSAFTGVAGIGHRFASSLTLQAEYLRNGQGSPDDFASGLVRFGAGTSFHLSRNVLGLLATHELLPILLLRAATLVSLDDGSVQVQPGLVWSLLDEVEVVAGALWSFGSRPASTPPTIGDPLGLAGLRSEFGSFPHVWYAEVKAYF